MKQRSLRRWMVVNSLDTYYCEEKKGYPFWRFTEDWTNAYFFENMEDAEDLTLRWNTEMTLKVVRVRVILQHLEELEL